MTAAERVRVLAVLHEDRFMDHAPAEVYATLLDEGAQTGDAFVSREAIFSLRRIDIDDDRWKSAIRAINDSIRIQGSKTYLRFYRRATPGDRWDNVTIDLASAALPSGGVAQAAE